MHRPRAFPPTASTKSTTSTVTIVAYERLLLPFSDGGNVTHIVASLKTISEDGGFEIKNLMRGGDKLPTPTLRTIIDRDLFHRAPGRIPAGDILEFG